ncbi:MAG: STAS domain-containing protein [Gammaproteobacteria bacterium]
MLKITDDPAPATHRIFRLEGRIAGPWIAELQSLCEAALREGSALALDLSGVSFLDRSATSLLRDLVQRGVALVGCTAFVAEQLQRENGSA